MRAVDGVSFTIAQGETLGLVGESGCGKSTLARALLFLDPPTSGEIVFDGTRVTEADVGRLRRARPDRVPGSLRLAPAANAGGRRSSPTRC